MKQFIFLFFITSFLEVVHACPGCIGSANSTKDRNVFIIVGVFVVLIYIPMFILYRMIYKNRGLNKTLSN